MSSWTPLFRPTLTHPALGTLLYVGLPVFEDRHQVVCGAFAESCPPYLTVHDSVLTLLFGSTGDLVWSWRPVWAVFAVAAASLVVVAAWRALPLRWRLACFRALVPSRGRLVVAGLGWATVPALAMHYWSGRVGGITNFSAMEGAVYALFETVTVVLLPFGLLTLLVLWPLARVALARYGSMANVDLGVSASAYPEDLSLVGVALVMALCAIVWYVIACALVSWWGSWRSRRARSQAGSVAPARPR